MRLARNDLCFIHTTRYLADPWDPDAIQFQCPYGAPCLVSSFNFKPIGWTQSTMYLQNRTEYLDKMKMFYNFQKILIANQISSTWHPHLLKACTIKFEHLQPQRLTNVCRGSFLSIRKPIFHIYKFLCYESSSIWNKDMYTKV